MYTCSRIFNRHYLYLHIRIVLTEFHPNYVITDLMRQFLFLRVVYFSVRFYSRAQRLYFLAIVLGRFSSFLMMWMRRFCKWHKELECEAFDRLRWSGSNHVVQQHFTVRMYDIGKFNCCTSRLVFLSDLPPVEAVSLFAYDGVVTTNIYMFNECTSRRHVRVNFHCNV